MFVITSIDSTSSPFFPQSVERSLHTRRNKEKRDCSLSAASKNSANEHDFSLFVVQSECCRERERMLRGGEDGKEAVWCGGVLTARKRILNGNHLMFYKLGVFIGDYDLTGVQWLQEK